jgi:serine protease Do
MVRNRALLAMTMGMALLASHPALSRAARVGPPMLAEGGFADIVEKTLPSVVRVVTTTSAAAPRGKSVSGEGSGIVLSHDGYLLTNNHVIAGATKIAVQLHDDRELSATLIAADGPSDLAVLKVEASGLQAIEFGDSSKARIGDYVLAIGNPFGVGTTVTLGIISAKGEADYIQTDAAINPGNSGGPLLNIRGELIGINTAILSSSGGSNGVGFALPSNLTRFIMTELITKGGVNRGYLGAGFQPLTEALQEALGVRRGAALVADVAPDSPAAKAGLRKGDVVVAMNGRVLRDFRRLQLYAAQARPQALVQLTIARDDAELVLPITLGERPEGNLSLPQEEVLAGAAFAESGAAGIGPVVTAVDLQGVSADAGLRPGDVIVAVNRKPVAGMAGLREQLANREGKPVLLEISRGGSTYFVAVPLQ